QEGTRNAKFAVQIDTMPGHEPCLNKKQDEPRGKQQPVQVKQKRQPRGFEKGSQVEGVGEPCEDDQESANGEARVKASVAHCRRVRRHDFLSRRAWLGCVPQAISVRTMPAHVAVPARAPAPTLAATRHAAPATSAGCSRRVRSVSMTINASKSRYHSVVARISSCRKTTRRTMAAMSGGRLASSMRRLWKSGRRRSARPLPASSAKAASWVNASARKPVGVVPGGR